MDDLTKQIVELYQSGFPLKEVGEIVGRSMATVWKKLEKNKIPRRRSGALSGNQNSRKHFCDEDSVRQVVDLYLSGLSLEQVGIRVGVPASRVRARLEKSGVPRRSPGEANRKHSCDDNFFEIIDTEPKSNWLGFLAADGNLHSNKSEVRLKLERGDKDHVVKFKEALGATKLVYDREGIHKNGSTCYSSGISINSQKMYNDLISHGVPPRKSLILKPPVGVPKHLTHHWIRGYFDGDGCVSFTGEERRTGEKKGTRRVLVKITSTERVLKFIQERLGGMGQKIRPASGSKSFSLVIKVQEDVKKFYNYIYKDATVYLERKKKFFDESYLMRDPAFATIGEING